MQDGAGPTSVVSSDRVFAARVPRGQVHHMARDLAYMSMFILQGLQVKSQRLHPNSLNQLKRIQLQTP